MAYTPINWQTGDTITADKLNRCDNGWAVESTQLFSETVTTSGDGIYEGELAYSQLIDADTITVTYDGTEYECPSIGAGEYGAPYSDSDFDFSVYPFNLYTNSGSAAYLTTQTAGTHTIAVAAQTIVTSSDFTAAVATAAPLLQIVQKQTTWQQVYDAMAAGKIAYYFFDSGDSAYTYFAEEACFDDSDSRYRVWCNGGNMTLSAESSSGALFAD